MRFSNVFNVFWTCSVLFLLTTCYSLFFGVVYLLGCGRQLDFFKHLANIFVHSKQTENNLVKVLVVSNSLQSNHVQLFAIPWTVACQASLSMEFSRQEYWCGQPFPSPGNLPDPRIKPRSPALQADSLLSEPPEKPYSI